MSRSRAGDGLSRGDELAATAVETWGQVCLPSAKLTPTAAPESTHRPARAQRNTGPEKAPCVTLRTGRVDNRPVSAFTSEQEQLERGAATDRRAPAAAVRSGLLTTARRSCGKDRCSKGCVRDGSEDREGDINHRPRDRLLASLADGAKPSGHNTPGRSGAPTLWSMSGLQQQLLTRSPHPGHHPRAQEAGTPPQPRGNDAPRPDGSSLRSARCAMNQQVPRAYVDTPTNTRQRCPRTLSM